MSGFVVDEVRVTTKCNQCDGLAIADFDKELWICENGHKFSITIRELKKLSVDWDALLEGAGKRGR